MEEKNKSNLKLYSIIIILQVLVLMIFSVATYFLFKIESVILNPIPYTIGIGAFMIVIDLLILILIKEYRNIMKILIVLLVTGIMMTLFSFVIYDKISKPKYYSDFMKLGNKYLTEGKYDEAILEFDKAIIIEPKSTEARLCSANSYIGVEDVDSAINSLKEAQQIDIENEELLLEILQILKDIDLEKAYQFLKNYTDKVGEDNISQKIKEIIYLSKENPSQPISNLKPGKYITPISVKLKLDKIRVGSVIYYTIDGSEPNKNSLKYNYKIDINKDTQIKLIVCNVEGKSTDVFTLDYVIDSQLLKELELLIKECNEKVNETRVGTNVGNCVEGAKDEFKVEIERAKKLVQESEISYDSANEIYLSLKHALEIFNNKIIEETNRGQLKETIDKARAIHDKAIEGKKEGDYKIGSKKILLDEIYSANKVYKEILSRQKDIDVKDIELKKAINNFENSKVKIFNQSIALQYFKNKYGVIPYHREGDFSSGKSPVEGLDLYEYEFVGSLKTEGGLKYYTLHMYSVFPGEQHVFTDEVKIYENGKISMKQIF